VHILRSSSVGPNDFKSDINREVIILNPITESLLETCFLDLFTEDGARESPSSFRASRDVSLRYEQFYELFGDGRNIIEKEAFITGLKTAAANFIRKNRPCISMAE